MLIQSIDEILDLFPSVSGDSDGELHTACPFCTEGRKIVKNGITFRGDDRLVWFTDRKGVACRQCGTYASMDRLLELLAPGSELSEDFVKDASEKVETKKKPLYECLTESRYVQKLHNNVDRAYWKKFLWSDATIDRFQLGFGQLYEFGSWKQPRHIIPFRPRNAESELDGYMLEGRLNKRSDETEFERYNVKTQGSVRGFFWLIKDAPSSSELVIAEGPKDAITAWQLGYKNVMAIFGTALWRPNFAPWIADEGYTKVTIFGDNDDAGRNFAELVAKDLHSAGVTPYRINWPEGLKQGFDLTDALVEHGEEGIKEFLLRCISHATASRRWIPNIQTFLPDYTPPTPDKALPLQTVRADMPAVLHDYVDNYKVKAKSAGRGVVKVLAAPPGSGKSYSLVHLAQEEAKKILERREQFKADYEATRQKLFDEYNAADEAEKTLLKNSIATLDEKWASYSMAKVLFAVPFKNAWDDIKAQPGFKEELWFNFEPRDKDTCDNNVVAKAIADKGYSVMKFCETACPFAEDCASRVRGYLMQRKLMKTRPITFVRHANLRSVELLKQYEVIIIDENFLNVFADFVDINDLVPAARSWRDYLTVEEDDAADDIEDLAKAIVELNKQQEELSGRDCLLALEKLLGRPLAPLMRGIPETLVKKFQPTAAPQNTDIKDLPPCVFPTFYRAIMEELNDFEKGENYNSRIHLAKVDGNEYRLRVSTLFPLELARNKKIIVADGTAMPELYGLMFDREVELYEPDIHNPSAKIVQLTGSDMSRNTILSQIGPQAYRNLGKPEEALPEVTDIFGEIVDLSDIRYTEEMWNSPAITGLLTLIRLIALKPEHEKVLFVTYKNLKAALEGRINKLAETDSDYDTVSKKVAFGHYNGLRGTNRYKDFDAVLLAGCPRQPYTELWHVIQAWARLKQYNKFIPNQLGYKPAAYHGVGLYSGYTYRTFEDEFAQLFVEMVEVGEIRQCLDRIRIYSSGSKTAYLYMARPAAKWITEVTGGRKMIRIADDSKYQEVENYVREIWEEFKAWPTYNDVGTQFSLSFRKAKEYVETAKKALNPVSA